MSNDDLCHHFAKLAVEASYEKLPPDAIDRAKKSILDGIGVCLGGSGMEPAARPFIDLAIEHGGRPESTIIGFRKRAPAPLAAFANGATVHALDFDDQSPWGQHSGSSIIPPVLAVAERKRKISGKRMITAIAIGQDLFARLRCHVEWIKDWNFSIVAGMFFGTAACGHILGLSYKQMVSALSIGGMQASGTMEVIIGRGGDVRATYPAFSCQSIVNAVLLAEKGVNGVETMLEGPNGILPVYFRNNYDRDAILKDLGKDFRGGHTLYKAWSAVGTGHSHIHATITLVNQHKIKPDDIQEIRVNAGDYHMTMCEPLEVRQVPQTIVDARFSLPFLVAIAAVRGAVTVADFKPEGLKDAQVLAMAKRVVPVPDSSRDWKLTMLPGRVEIVTKSGRNYSAEGTDVPGIEVPMDWTAVREKFSQCAGVAANPLPSENVKGLCDMVEHLEMLDDAAEIMSHLA